VVLVGKVLVEEEELGWRVGWYKTTREHCSSVSARSGLGREAAPYQSNPAARASTRAAASILRWVALMSSSLSATASGKLTRAAFRGREDAGRLDGARLVAIAAPWSAEAERSRGRERVVSELVDLPR
jgi:hypothetical protein